MANHHVLDSHGADISGEDTWQALATAQLPDGIALSNLTLLELLHKQEKVDVLVPLADLLNADGKLANGLLEQVLDILKQHSSRLGVWITSNTDADDLPDVKDFGATSFVLNEHDAKSDISQAFTALASSYDGRDASALPMFSKN